MLQVVVVPLRVNVNLKAATVEDLIGRRKARPAPASHASSVRGGLMRPFRRRPRLGQPVAAGPGLNASPPSGPPPAALLDGIPTAAGGMGNLSHHPTAPPPGSPQLHGYGMTASSPTPPSFPCRACTWPWSKTSGEQSPPPRAPQAARHLPRLGLRNSRGPCLPPDSLQAAKSYRQLLPNASTPPLITARPVVGWEGGWVGGRVGECIMMENV